MNGGGLAGIGLSLFVVPPNTPLWLWGTVSVVALAVFNYLLARRLRRGTGDSTFVRTSGSVAWLGVVFFLLELVFRFWHR